MVEAGVGVDKVCATKNHFFPVWISPENKTNDDDDDDNDDYNKAPNWKLISDRERDDFVKLHCLYYSEENIC